MEVLELLSLEVVSTAKLETVAAAKLIAVKALLSMIAVKALLSMIAVKALLSLICWTVSLCLESLVLIVGVLEVVVVFYSNQMWVWKLVSAELEGVGVMYVLVLAISLLLLGESGIPSCAITETVLLPSKLVLVVGETVIIDESILVGEPITAVTDTTLRLGEEVSTTALTVVSVKWISARGHSGVKTTDLVSIELVIVFTSSEIWGLWSGWETLLTSFMILHN